MDDFVLGVSHSLRSWVLVEMETMSGRGFGEDLGWLKFRGCCSMGRAD